MSVRWRAIQGAKRVLGAIAAAAVLAAASLGLFAISGDWTGGFE
jgi:hypothetical protein